jgi:hypothetical protein
MLIAKKYRDKALAAEKVASEMPNYDFKCAWSDIAVEWHALASRRALEVSLHREVGNIPT